MVGAIAGAAETRLPLQIGAGIGLVLACYVLTLPKTMPSGEAKGGGLAAKLGLDVIVTQGTRNFWVVVGATFFIMLPMAFYYAYANNFLTEMRAGISIGGL